MATETYVGLVTYSEAAGTLELYVARNPWAAFYDRWVYTSHPDGGGVTVNDLAESYHSVVENRAWARLSPNGFWESPTVGSLDALMCWAARVLCATGIDESLIRPLFCSGPGQFEGTLSEELVSRREWACERAVRNTDIDVFLAGLASAN